MVKKSIDAKVRPLANASLEKTSLLGAARLYISKDSMIALTNGLESNKPCLVEKLSDDAAQDAIVREASLCVLPEKNLSPNVVMMTRAFQDASGFKVGDQIRVSLLDKTPDAEDVVVRNTSDEKDADQDSKYPVCWEYAISVALGKSIPPLNHAKLIFTNTFKDRAEQVFPGMVLEGVNISKLRRTYKVISVNGKSANLARFQISTTAIRILQPDETDESAITSGAAAVPAGDLVIKDVPGLDNQISTLNRFLKTFGRPLWVPEERQSCAYVIHGGPGTGKTFILKRLAATNWGKVFWLRPSDKLTTIRETFKLAQAQQPCMIFLENLEKLLDKERSNRDAVVETLGDELDALSESSKLHNILPSVVVLATCRDYMGDVPAELQKRSRMLANIALPIPRAPERLEILRFLNPPLEPSVREACLASISSRTHAYNGDDLANLILNATTILGERLDSTATTATAPPSPDQKYYLHPADMENALRITRPTAMNDINLRPPTIHWKDVGGQDSLKKVLSRMIKNTKDTNPASRKLLRQPPKGLLLYGPPGCSKTLSAQAMATESSFNFFAVKGAELLNMYVGESERAVRTLFERARAAAPSIIFFDEIDSIGGQRSGGSGTGASSTAGRSSGSVNMLTTLLTEMDGFEALNGVLILAATNRPESIDPALMRPGRFDKIVYVGPPDQPAREAVFGVHLRGLSTAADVDIAALARAADGYSGAEIKAICNEAGLAVLDRYEDDMTDDKPDPEIAMADLLTAIEHTPRNITMQMLMGYENWARQFKKLF